MRETTRPVVAQYGSNPIAPQLWPVLPYRFVTSDFPMEVHTVARYAYSIHR